ncbi:MAG: Ldh family oxidoreductase [Candidatus Levyibacteriota bacterium]
MKIKIEELEQLILLTLLTKYTLEEANLIKDVVLFGELSGKPSHGLLRLLKENFGVFTDTIKGKPVLIRKTDVSTLIDGNGNVGMLMGSLAMQEVIKLGAKHGIGIVGTKGSVNSTGSLSYYSEK